MGAVKTGHEFELSKVDNVCKIYECKYRIIFFSEMILSQSITLFLKSVSFVSFTDKNFKCLTEIKILSVRMFDTKIQDVQ